MPRHMKAAIKTVGTVALVTAAFALLMVVAVAPPQVQRAEAQTAGETVYAFLWISGAAPPNSLAGINARNPTTGMIGTQFNSPANGRGIFNRLYIWVADPNSDNINIAIAGNPAADTTHDGPLTLEGVDGYLFGFGASRNNAGVAITVTFANPPTATPTHTPTYTPTYTPTHTPTNTPTATPSVTPTNTPTPTPTPTAIVNGVLPTVTSTATATGLETLLARQYIRLPITLANQTDDSHSWRTIYIHKDSTPLRIERYYGAAKAYTEGRNETPGLMLPNTGEERGWYVVLPAFAAQDATTIELDIGTGPQFQRYWPIQSDIDIYQESTTTLRPANALRVEIEVELDNVSNGFLYDMGRRSYDQDTYGNFATRLAVEHAQADGTGTVAGMIRYGTAADAILRVDCGSVSPRMRTIYSLQYDTGTFGSSLRCYVGTLTFMQTSGNPMTQVPGELVNETRETTRHDLAYQSGDSFLKIGAGRHSRGLTGRVYSFRYGTGTTLRTGLPIRAGTNTTSATAATLGDWTVDTSRTLTPSDVEVGTPSYVGYEDSVHTEGLTGASTDISELTGVDESGNLASVFLDPLRLLMESTGIGAEASFLFLGLVIATIAGARVYVLTRNTLAAFAITSILILCVGPPVALYPWWVVFVYALWCFGVNTLWTRGVQLGGSSMTEWFGVLAAFGAIMAILEALYMGQAFQGGTLNSLQVVSGFELISDTISVFGINIGIPFINFAYFGALWDVLTPSFTFFFTGPLRFIGVLLQLIFTGMMATVAVRWIAPLVAAITNTIRR